MGGEDKDGQKAPTPNIPKTPVSLLQELYVRKGITPKYDLVQIEGAVHEPTFKYRVTVGDVIATGCGASKKKAKHEAAKNILTRLKSAQDRGLFRNSEDGESTGTELEPVTEESARRAAARKLAASVVRGVELPDLDKDLMSPYDDGISGNPVGELQEICMNRRMQPPVYEVSLEEGAPHERNFVINCLVGSKFRESGCGKSKKLAKRKAASKMLNTLKAQPVLVDENDPALGVVGTQIVVDEDELVQGIAQRTAMLKIQQQKEADNCAGTASYLAHMAKFYKNFKTTEGTLLSKLQDPDGVPELEKCVPLLEEISEEQKFSVTYVDVEERSKSGRHQCFVQMATNPVAVCFGVGEKSDEEAKNDAARNALNYLRIMTK